MTKCIEPGCEEPAGTPWTHLWCPAHDEERRARITASLERMSESLGLIPPWKDNDERRRDA